MAAMIVDNSGLKGAGKSQTFMQCVASLPYEIRAMIAVEYTKLRLRDPFRADLRGLCRIKPVVSWFKKAFDMPAVLQGKETKWLYASMVEATMVIVEVIQRRLFLKSSRDNGRPGYIRGIDVFSPEDLSFEGEPPGAWLRDFAERLMADPTGEHWIPTTEMTYMIDWDEIRAHNTFLTPFSEFYGDNILTTVESYDELMAPEMLFYPVLHLDFAYVSRSDGYDMARMPEIRYLNRVFKYLYGKQMGLFTGVSKEFDNGFIRPSNFYLVQ